MTYLGKRLQGKNILITGAGSGIGKAIAILFASEGANIAVNDLNSESAERTAQEVKKLGQKSIIVVADVTESQAVKEMVKACWINFEKIDILVNNAGIGASFTSIIHTKNEIWDRVIRTNLRSVFLVSKYVGRKMIKNKTPKDQLRGKIINMSSMRGKSGRSGLGAYSASKAGIVSLTQTLALELGKYRITVNAICPGLIHTPIYGNISIENLAGSSLPTCLKYKPVGLPEDVARVALFLASSDSDFTTGQSIPVSGGQSFV
ncbi:MAG: SDR family oxidoreductase [Candidatus Helarchaeota archaeon]|nr:SDR family oxidoreductase [Candidatus Helarchaeota archaeon]